MKCLKANSVLFCGIQIAFQKCSTACYLDTSIFIIDTSVRNVFCLQTTNNSHNLARLYPANIAGIMANGHLAAKAPFIRHTMS